LSEAHPGGLQVLVASCVFIVSGADMLTHVAEGQTDRHEPLYLEYEQSGRSLGDTPSVRLIANRKKQEGHRP